MHSSQDGSDIVADRADYSFAAIPPVQSLADAPAPLLGALALYAALAACAVLAVAADDRPTALAACWLVAPFLPASNILFPVATVMGERLLYTPSIGFVMLVVHAGTVTVWRKASSSAFARRLVCVHASIAALEAFQCR